MARTRMRWHGWWDDDDDDDGRREEPRRRTGRSRSPYRRPKKRTTTQNGETDEVREARGGGERGAEKILTQEENWRRL